MKKLGEYGKWILGGLGWAFGGPIGGIIGFLMGSAFESMDSGEFEYQRTPDPRVGTRSGDFRISLLVLSAAVMRADGKQMKSELDFVKAFFVQNFGQQQAQNYMRAFRDILKQDIPLRDVCLQIRNYMDLHSRLQLLHYLFGLSLADGKAPESEVKTIENIANWMGVNQSDFVSIKSMFIKDTDSAYKVLEISPDSSDDQVKRAYRNMALKYHPDRVVHLGEEFQKAAKEKFQKVNEAYETIKEKRGM